MNQLNDLIGTRVICHEFGHLFTCLFFKNIGIEYKKPSQIEFYKYTSTANCNRFGQLVGVSEIDKLPNEPSKEEVVKLAEKILPTIVGWISGCVFERLVFFQSAIFLQRLDTCSGDFMRIHGLKVKIGFHASSNSVDEDSIARSYLKFLNENLKTELNEFFELVYRITEDNMQKTTHGECTTYIISSTLLHTLTEKIEEMFQSKIQKSFPEWYEKLKARHTIQIP